MFIGALDADPGGTAIPAKLVRVGYQALRKQSSRAYRQLDSFAWKACTLPGMVGAAYPTTGPALVSALAEHRGLAFSPGSPGGMGWVLPDREAFNAGVTDVICVFALDPAALAAGVGDVRQLETSQVLPKFRSCVSIAADRTRTTVPCDVVHDRETFGWITMAVEGLPKDLRTWTDTNWSPFDAACAALGEVLMGGAHPEVKVAADTDFDIPAETSVRGVSTLNREFSCNVKPPDAGPSPGGHRDRAGRQEARPFALMRHPLLGSPR